LPTNESIEATKALPEVQKAIEEKTLQLLVKNTIAGYDLELGLKLALMA
jgi:hypothetical protein